MLFVLLAPQVPEKSQNLLRSLHVAAEELTDATSPIPLKLFGVSEHTSYIRPYLGCIFDLPSKNEYSFCGELYARAYVTNDEINGASLPICVFPSKRLGCSTLTHKFINTLHRICLDILNVAMGEFVFVSYIRA